jgi:hypothetical protein
LPEDRFEKLMAELKSLAKEGQWSPARETAAKLKGKPVLAALLKEMAEKVEEFYPSGAEMVAESVARCNKTLERVDGSYRFVEGNGGAVTEE